MTCEYCRGSSIPGIHLPSDFDDREGSRDGKVFVARCDECWNSSAQPSYGSDLEAAEAVSKKMGWTIQKSMDSEDAIDLDERQKAKGQDWYRPYFKITLAEAEAANSK